jgi:hypothetical protein
MKYMSNKDLAIQATAIPEPNSGFLALRDFSLADAIAEELSGLDGGFERIKIPGAGGTVYELPGEEAGESDAAKEFSAVILYHHPMFAYYRDKYTGGNTPPDCLSYDGVTGSGFPGGDCAVCPCNQFGTGENGAKACKNKRRLYLLREGEIFPLLLTLPNGSLKEFGRYVKRLLSRGRKSNAVLTRFSLTKATNAGGLVYSQAQFATERVLEPEEAELLRALSEQVKAHSQLVGFTEASAEENSFIDPETGEITPPLARA